MRLTPILCSPPRFHYWKDFGAGKKRRIGFYKTWWNYWRNHVYRTQIKDYTLSVEQLPSGSRLMDAEDFMKGPLDAMPEDLIKMKEERVVYDHPWPFGVQLDPIEKQERMHNYCIETRFFVPRQDCLTLTNTLLESDSMKARPPIEPTTEHMDILRRQIEWATKGDSVMVRLPRSKKWPRIDQKPRAAYGVVKERQETSILSSMFDYSQNIMAQHYHKNQNNDPLNELLQRRTIAFPKCQVPFERQNAKINLELCIDSMSVSKSPLPLIEKEPRKTTDKEPVNIKPRTWKSILESNNNYSPDWCFTLPRNAYPHTIQLASRIIRAHRDPEEMLARSIIHAFGLTTQVARLRSYESHLMNRSGEEISKQASIILQDPLKQSPELSDKDLLDEPIVVQIIGYDLPMGQFHFTRFQLNTTKFDDNNESRIKNQAWYSGPINDFNEALRFYIDFQAFNVEEGQLLY